MLNESRQLLRSCKTNLKDTYTNLLIYKKQNPDMDLFQVYIEKDLKEIIDSLDDLDTEIGKIFP